MIAIGFDGGMRNLGVGVVSFGRDVPPRIVELACWSTTIDDREVRSDDATRRARELASRILALRSYGPAVVCAEAFSPPRSASAAAKVAMVWGAIVTFAAAERIDLVTLSPKELKAAVGASDSSKAAMARAMRAEWGSVALDEALRGVRPRSLHEHPIDALATISAWFRSAGPRARFINGSTGEGTK